MSQQVMVVELIIAIVIVLSISNTMTMNVLKRTSEIGTCLAIGRRRLQILRQFLYEGLTIGLIGGALGLFLGSLLAALISTIGIPMPPPPGMSEGYTGAIMLTWGWRYRPSSLRSGRRCWPASIRRGGRRAWKLSMPSGTQR